MKTMMYLMGYGPVMVEKQDVPRPVIKVVDGQKTETTEMKRVNVCYTQPILRGGRVVRQELPDDRFRPMEEIYLPAVVDALNKEPERAVRMDHHQRRTYLDKVNGSLEEVAEALADLQEVRGVQAMQFRGQATQILLRTAQCLIAGKTDPDPQELMKAAKKLRKTDPRRRILTKIGHRESLSASKAA